MQCIVVLTLSALCLYSICVLHSLLTIELDRITKHIISDNRHERLDGKYIMHRIDMLTLAKGLLII